MRIIARRVKFSGAILLRGIADPRELEFGARGQQHLLEVISAWGSIQAAVKAFAYPRI
jgi:hypothetical protein